MKIKKGYQDKNYKIFDKILTIKKYSSKIITKEEKTKQFHLSQKNAMIETFI